MVSPGLTQHSTGRQKQARFYQLANYWLKDVIVSKVIPFLLLSPVSLTLFALISFSLLIKMVIAVDFQFGLETHYFSKQLLFFTDKANDTDCYILDGFMLKNML